MPSFADRCRASDHRFALALLAAVLATLPFSTLAQDRYPTRAVRIVAPFSPGGGVDIIARPLAARLSERFGQQFVIDNRPGAGGIVGVEIAAKAAPDGYTLIIVSSSYGANPALYKLPYDPVNAFDPITQLSQQPFIVALHPSVPVNSVKELIAYAKAKPLTYGSSGAGGMQHLGVELFKTMAHVNMTHVPYKGTGPALNDTVAGQIQVIFGSILATLPQVKSGRLKAIAVTGLKRVDALPDMPTVDEAGVPGYSFVGWYAALAPARTPRAIMATLNREIVRAMQLPEIRDRLAAEGSMVVAGTPEQAAAHIRQEIDKWRKVVKEANIRLDASK